MRSVHAEVNAINRALEKVQTLLRSCDMYTLHSPCAPCADLIIKSGLKRVYYRHPYRLRDGLNMLMEPRHGIEVFRVTQAGMVINERTNELVMEK
jgi:dCMP deaminase